MYPGRIVIIDCVGINKSCRASGACQSSPQQPVRIHRPLRAHPVQLNYSAWRPSRPSQCGSRYGVPAHRHTPRTAARNRTFPVWLVRLLSSWRSAPARAGTHSRAQVLCRSGRSSIVRKAPVAPRQCLRASRRSAGPQTACRDRCRRTCSGCGTAVRDLQDIAVGLARRRDHRAAVTRAAPYFAKPTTCTPSPSARSQLQRMSEPRPSV